MYYTLVNRYNMERERMTEQELQENRACREKMIEAKIQLMAEQQEPIPEDVQKVVDDHFWEMI